ncbi:nuclear transport factor 2 family protein [Ponticaulis sp.]|uniref:nuclear transport factor 2 family protein n=1 Tax=Ponticaulis sp. TaxID=2020902 RepID=UPI000B7491D0|nr:nuclear transport factor 2 family protein [Ponticaulis sp.]MAI89288.1 hypothetical protein [Ponticaulis sp.]OUY01271.1 MAG: hypothetical protein CBB65_02235 [Hyphomonadaceae bacterium TMED5]
MESIEELIERYVDCYNRVDVDGMLECVTDDVRFENISNAGQSMQLEGKDALAQVAAASSQAFTFRRQRLMNVVSSGENAAAEVEFQGIAALDLPNGTMQGQSVELKGASFFEARDGLLSRIVDYS